MTQGSPLLARGRNRRFIVSLSLVTFTACAGGDSPSSSRKGNFGDPPGSRTSSKTGRTGNSSVTNGKGTIANGSSYVALGFASGGRPIDPSTPFRVNWVPDAVRDLAGVPEGGSPTAAQWLSALRLTLNAQTTGGAREDMRARASVRAEGPLDAAALLTKLRLAPEELAGLAVSLVFTVDSLELALPLRVIATSPDDPNSMAPMPGAQISIVTPTPRVEAVDAADYCKASSGALVPPSSVESQPGFASEYSEPGVPCVEGTRKRTCDEGTWSSWSDEFPTTKCERLSYPYETHPDPILRRVVPVVLPIGDGKVRVVSYGLSMANGLFVSTIPVSLPVAQMTPPAASDASKEGFLLRRADGTTAIVPSLGKAPKIELADYRIGSNFGFTAIAAPAPAGSTDIPVVAPETNLVSAGAQAQRITLSAETFSLAEPPTVLFETAAVVKTHNSEGVMLSYEGSAFGVGTVAYRRKACVGSPTESWFCRSSEEPAAEKAPSFVFLEGSSGKELAGIESRQPVYDITVVDAYPPVAPNQSPPPPATLLYGHHFPHPGALRGLFASILLGAPKPEALATLKSTGTCPAPCVLANARIDFPLKGAKLAGADLRNAVLDSNVLDGADLSGADLRYATFNTRKFVGTDFSGARLEGTSFVHSNLTGAIFRGARLSGASFIQSRLPGADFHSAVLTGAEFLQSYLADSDWSGADATGASVSQSNLPRSKFLGSALANSEFSQSCVRDSNFQGANFVGSKFSQTCTAGVIAPGASALSGSQNYTNPTDHSCSWGCGYAPSAYVWTFEKGARISATNYASPYLLDNANWKVVGVGDLDADGRTDDVLWKETEEGTLQVVRMQGTTVVDRKVLPLEGDFRSLRVLGFGEADAAGNQNDLYVAKHNGDVLVYLNVSVTAAPTGTLTITAAELAKALDAAKRPGRPFQVGDFDSDGKADDLLLIVSGDGTSVPAQLRFASLENGSFVGAKFTELPISDTGRSPPDTYVSGVGDFDGDGFRDDVAIRRMRDPILRKMDLELWMRDTAGIVSSKLPLASVEPAIVEKSVWVPRGYGDFDGDGKVDDILW